MPSRFAIALLLFASFASAQVRETVDVTVTNVDLIVTDAKGNQSTMTYDTLSRKTTMHDPDMGSWTYTHDAAGNLTQQTDAKSQAIYFRYDALNRRKQKDYGTQKPVGSGDVMYNIVLAAGNNGINYNFGEFFSKPE